MLVERVGNAEQGIDVPGDESKGIEGVPIWQPYDEHGVTCPGLDPRLRP